MPPKKKQIKNPFYFFMKDFKEEMEKNGIVFHGGMKEVAELAGPQWNAMNFEEKEYYNRLAAKAKKKDSEDLTKKFTSLGVSYADLDAEEREQEEAYQGMVETVKGIMRSLNRESTLKTRTFYVCHVNYYYKTDKGHYCPAEMALAEFNLEQGLVDTMHTYIHPGKLELGFRFEATDWSLKTHNLPLDDPNWNHGERDYYKLFLKTTAFLRKGNSREIPPIFTMPDSLNNNTSISAVKSVFFKIAEAGEQDPGIFRIYPLPYFFFKLRNHCVDENEDISGEVNRYLPTVALAENEMEKDVFTYAKNLGCEFHEEKDLATFCSLSVVTRWVFTVCDHCCNQLGIKLILGHHCPKDADVNRTLLFEPSDYYDDEDDDENDKQLSRLGAAGPLVIVEHDRDTRTTKETSFMPTIIDHGKLREQEMAQRNSQSSTSYTLPEDVRLPKKASYSSAARQNTSSEPVPQLTARNFPTMAGPSHGASGSGMQQEARATPRPVFGRGRGLMRAQYQGNSNQPTWPVSGRGSSRHF